MDNKKRDDKKHLAHIHKIMNIMPWVVVSVVILTVIVTIIQLWLTQ